MDLKNRLKCLLVIVASLLVFPAVAFAANPCGNWEDVVHDDPDLEALILVCEQGYFIGNSAGNLRADDPLTRVETAVILNRVFGVDDEFDQKKDEISFEDEYFAENLENDDAQWVYRAVRNAATHQVDEAFVFKGYKDGTFRPFDKIRFVEFSKVFLMSLKASEAAAYDAVFDFSKDPWFTDLITLLENFEGSFSLFETEGIYAVNSNLGTAEVELGTELTRRQAIVFLSSLIEQGYLTGTETYENGFIFDYPTGFHQIEGEDEVTFAAEDGVTAKTGLQRVSAGLYEGTVRPEGTVLLVPEHMANDVSALTKFESCDQTGNCQVAYFFDALDGSVYFLEISYLSSKFATAKLHVEEIYQSFVFTE